MRRFQLRIWNPRICNPQPGSGFEPVFCAIRNDDNSLRRWVEMDDFSLGIQVQLPPASAPLSGKVARRLCPKSGRKCLPSAVVRILKNKSKL
jgi:hypothetical protein